MTAPEKPKFPAYEALCRGVREAAVENEAIGGIEQFRKPGEHVPPVNRPPSTEQTLTVEEWLDKYASPKETGKL